MVRNKTKASLNEMLTYWGHFCTKP